MDQFLSVLCPGNMNNFWHTGSSNKEETNSQIACSSKGTMNSAASKRSSYSFFRKYTQSLPNCGTTGNNRSRHLYRQFSLSDIAMRNNCTVINNKVGPVVIRNCKEEYQMRETVSKVQGRLHDSSAEHELLLDHFFLLKDHFVGIDRHDTMEKHMVPNLRMSGCNPSFYVIGQPTMNGLKNFTTTLLSKHKLVYYVNVRAVPTLFLRRSGDFLPYSAYSPDQGHQGHMYMTERQLHDAEREMQLQALEIASSNSDMFYYYNVLDTSPDEPHMYKTSRVDDLVTSRQMYAKIQSEHQNFKYKRLVLSSVCQPTSEWVDSLLSVLEDSNVFHEEGAAIVFQGLTGEGPALLAMMLTSLAVMKERPVLTTPQQKLLTRVQAVQRCAAWRELIIQRLFESSNLDTKLLRQEVDSIIASNCTPVTLTRILRETRMSYIRRKQGLELGLANAGHPAGDEACESSAFENGESSQNTRGLSTFKSVAVSLTLRDVSELSLPQSNARNFDERNNLLLRHEVCDEECLLMRLLLNPNIYYYLVLFRKYIREQESPGLHKTFSKWLAEHPRFIFDMSQISQFNGTAEIRDHGMLYATPQEIDTTPGATYHRVVGLPIYGVGQSLPEGFANIIKMLCDVDAKKRFERVIFFNTRAEMTFYSSDASSARSDRQWTLSTDTIPCIYGASSQLIEEIENRLANIINGHPDCMKFVRRDGQLHATHSAIKTTKSMFEELKTDDDVKSVCNDIRYYRLALPRYRIPRFQCFDRLVRTICDSYQENPSTAFIFFCKNGKRRSTNMMAAACLVLCHIQGFPGSIEETLCDRYEPWVPDAEYTRGEFKIVLELLQILPDCHLRKQEVDSILDLIYESMSTMHYHMRENLNPSYKKAKRAKTLQEFLSLKHRSFLNLEFYVTMILFNCYLENGKANFWQSLTFDEWMGQYASRLGVLELLNNFGFVEFGEDKPFHQMQNRWKETQALLRELPSESNAPRCEREQSVDDSISNLTKDSERYKSGSLSHL